MKFAERRGIFVVLQVIGWLAIGGSVLVMIMSVIRGDYVFVFALAGAAGGLATVAVGTIGTTLVDWATLWEKADHERRYPELPKPNTSVDGGQRTAGSISWR